MAERRDAKLLLLGRSDYRAAHALQLAMVARRQSGEEQSDIFLVTEHPPTFTLGRRGGREHLLFDEVFLREKNIPLVHIERGGDVTYHGPGQLVLYPIMHLRQAGLSVSDYVFCLEETMIGLSAACGVAATRDIRNRGVWVRQDKLGSIGIAIRHGVTYHGLALNVNTDLTPFSWINPCGLTGVRMTTISRECGRSIRLQHLVGLLPELLAKVFARQFSPQSSDDNHEPLP